MLKNALMILIYELFLKIFYEKKIKQLILLTNFYIFHKNDSFTKPQPITFNDMGTSWH